MQGDKKYEQNPLWVVPKNKIIINKSIMDQIGVTLNKPGDKTLIPCSLL